MEDLTVSVIVPNYNNERYLKQCLDSILVQTYPVKELIVYDDCSTDHSRDILEQYVTEHPQVKVIYGKQNVGVSVARDTAIRATTSDYVTMLDADDFYYDKYKLENEMRVVASKLKECGHKVIVFSQTIDVDEYGRPLGNVEHVDLSGNERFRIVTRLYKNYMPRDYCFPREAYEKCSGYTAGLSLYEDWELNIKFLQDTEFVYSENYGTAYRHKAGGLSAVDYKKQLETKKMIFKKYQTTEKEKVLFYLAAYAAYWKNRLREKSV